LSGISRFVVRKLRMRGLTTLLIQFMNVLVVAGCPLIARALALISAGRRCVPGGTARDGCLSP
jgi:hypothetical protein